MKTFITNIFSTSILFLTFCLFTCTSCINSIADTDDFTEQQSGKGVKDLTFQIEEYSVKPMATTRATTTKDFKYIEAALYTKDGNGEYTRDQLVEKSSTDPEFMKVEFKQVPYGNYTLVIIGHVADSHAVMTNPKAISFANDFVPQMQYYTQELTVDANSSTTNSIQLKLGMAYFAVELLEAIPSNVTKLALTIDGTAKAFNAIEGIGSVVAQRITSTSPSETGVPGKKLGVSLWLMNEKEEEGSSSVTIKLDATDADDRIVGTHTFSAIPLQRGYVTTYRGNFFNPALGAFELTKQTEFGEGYQGEF